MTPRIVCFGETLLDLLPTGPQPGGAPMNVAYHLCQLGLPTALISCLGADEQGDGLISFIESKGIDTRYMQRDTERPTGTVKVAFDGLEATYTIQEDVAWDNIAPMTLSEGVEWLVFGSLALRTETNQATLESIQQHSAVHLVFDVNLRAPFYTPQLINEWMRRATILKLNEHEFAIIAEWFQCHDAPALLELFPRPDVLIITKGDKGASVYTSTEVHHHPGFRVQVAETVGSGDAFLAAFLSQYLADAPITKALAWACAAGAFVASRPGATPSYRVEELAEWIGE